MNKYYLILLACLLGVSSIAQTGVVNYERNNFTWTQNTSGMLFYNSETMGPGLEVPAASGIYSVYAHNLIFAGLNANGEVHSHFQSYCQSPQAESCENVYGPVKIGGEINNNDEVMQYNRFWFVTRDQVETHMAYFECVNNPDCDDAVDFPGHQIPDDFLDWPAHGDEGLGFAQYLAPFFDVNNDDIYNAEDGDYPNFCGDFTSYLIHNDVGTVESTYNQQYVGLEIHTQVYGYDALAGAEFNTLFVRHKVINRSDETYADCYMGNFTDFDLGDSGDDFIGTDVSRSMYYVYNGNAFDAGSSSGPGFGDDLGAVGVKYLGGPYMDDDGEDNPFDSGGTYGNIGPGWGDGIVDNERLGLSSTIVSSSGSPSEMEIPVSPIQHYNYLTASWNNGLPLTFEGNGYNPDCTDCVEAQYSFPGISDPLHVGTQGVDPNYDDVNGWTEDSSGLPPGDRRVIAGSGPFTFAPGDSQTLDYSIVFARESYDDELTVVETIQQYADETVGMQCGVIPDVTNGIFDAPVELKFKAFPNPATDLVNIQLPKTFEHVTIEVLDMQSRVVFSRDLSQTDKGQLNLDVAKGQYILRVIADGEIGVSKLTKM